MHLSLISSDSDSYRNMIRTQRHAARKPSTFPRRQLTAVCSNHCTFPPFPLLPTLKRLLNVTSVTYIFQGASKSIALGENIARVLDNQAYFKLFLTISQLIHRYPYRDKLFAFISHGGCSRNNRTFVVDFTQTSYRNTIYVYQSLTYM